MIHLRTYLAYISLTMIIWSKGFSAHNCPLVVWYTISNMGWKEFAASVLGDVLSWPVVTLIVVLLLLKPLRKLIERVRTAKGFGGEVEFEELIKSMENKVDLVRNEEPSTKDVGDSEASRRSDNPPKADPSSNPSGAILISWKALIETLASLNRSTAGRNRPAINPMAIINQLKRNNIVSESFYDAFISLYEVRNQVAHGEVIPTTGTAITYVERATQLNEIAKGISAVQEMDLNKPAL